MLSFNAVAKRRFSGAAVAAALFGGVSAHALTYTQNVYLVKEGNPGVGAGYDTILAPWSEDVPFTQFSIAGHQLDSVTLSYSLFVGIDQYVKNSSRNSQTFTFENTVSGELSLGATPLISLSPVTGQNSVVLGYKGEKTFPLFPVEASRSITLSGVNLLPFLGSGSVLLTSYAEAVTTTSMKQNYSTFANGNALISLTYDYSEIPIPNPPTPPTPPANVPDAGGTGAMLGLAAAGVAGVRRISRRSENA